MKKALFLYTEPAAYTVNCLNKLSKSGVEVHCVRYPVNPEAPFEFEPGKGVIYYERKHYSARTLEALCFQIAPDIIICSGWIDKAYLRICYRFNKVIPTVLALDNHWNASLKQLLAVAAARLLIKSRFRYCWVPGDLQGIYARKLGFRSAEIETGFYTADIDYFETLHRKTAGLRSNRIPHRFLFVGRYVEYKGIRDLWEAFAQIDSSDWELWCLGTGPLFDQKPTHPKIKHFGFVQPADLDNFVRETGVFVLASHKEPWGVVLHEFAAASFPLVCSNHVGAATAFLKEGENGFIFEAANVQSLKAALQKCIAASDDELLQMGTKSAVFAKNYSPEKWVTTIKNWLRDNEEN